MAATAPTTGGASSGDVTIDMRGLYDLQKALRRTAPEVNKGINAEMRAIIKPVALKARVYAARDISESGAKTIKWSVSRSTATILTRLFWMRFQNDGFFPGGGQTYIPGARSLERARDDSADEVLRQLGGVIERAQRRAGGFS